MADVASKLDLNSIQEENLVVEMCLYCPSEGFDSDG
jgi:hypothetical protein